MDDSFQAMSGANQQVQVVALQADGRLLLGGQFTEIHGVGAGRIARVLFQDSGPTSAPVITSIGVESSLVRLNVTGTAGVRYVLEVAGELGGWSALTTNIPTSTTFQFVDVRAPAGAQFYRVRTP